MSSKKSKSRYSISYSEPSEAGLNIRPHGKTHHLFGSERFGQDNHRARAAPADSAAGILDLGHFARTARHGARRRGLLFPLARRIPPGGRRRAFRRMGGGLCRHLLRHAAQRTRPHLGERAYHSVRRRRAGRDQPQTHLRRRRLLRLHHAAVDRGAGTPARTPAPMLPR